MNINPPNKVEPDRNERIVPGSGTAVTVKLAVKFAPPALSKMVGPESTLLVVPSAKKAIVCGPGAKPASKLVD